MPAPTHMPEDWAVNMLLNLEDINHESALTVCWREQLVKIFDKKRICESYFFAAGFLFASRFS